MDYLHYKSDVMQLELKHMAAYLPHGLKVQAIGIHTKLEICGLNAYSYKIQNSLGKDTFSFQEIKLLLKPLSSLVIKDEFWEPEMLNHPIQGIVRNCENYCTAYDEWLDAYLDLPEPDKILQSPYEVLSELCRLHFDVFNLIPAGLAININD